MFGLGIKLGIQNADVTQAFKMFGLGIKLGSQNADVTQAFLITSLLGISVIFNSHRSFYFFFLSLACLLYLCLFICLFMSVCLPVSLPVCLPVCQSVFYLFIILLSLFICPIHWPTFTKQKAIIENEIF